MFVPTAALHATRPDWASGPLVATRRRRDPPACDRSRTRRTAETGDLRNAIEHFDGKLNAYLADGLLATSSLSSLVRSQKMTAFPLTSSALITLMWGSLRCLESVTKSSRWSTNSSAYMSACSLPTATAGSGVISVETARFRLMQGATSQAKQGRHFGV